MRSGLQSVFPINPQCVQWGLGQGDCEGHSSSSTPVNHFFIDLCAQGHHTGTKNGSILVQMAVLEDCMTAGLTSCTF